MVSVTAEKTVVELVGLVVDGGEELGSLGDASEAREEGDGLVLDERFGKQVVFDDGGESSEDFFGIGAQLEEEEGRVGEKRWM